MNNHRSLYFLSFIMGMCGIGFEYTFSKISSDLMGQTTTQWALIIGIMMFAMGLGADYQKKLSDINLFEKFIFLEIILSWLGGFGAIFLVYVFGEFRSYFVLVQYGICFSVGFLIGMEIPILARLNAKIKNNKISTKPIKQNLAQIFKMDYFGGFVGAILWALVMIRINESIIKVAFLLSILNIVGVLITMINRKKLNISTNWYMTIIFLLFFNLIINGFGFYSVKKWTPWLEQKLFKDRLVFSKTTTYQHITITENNNGNISLYINGNLQFSEFDEKMYHEWLVHPAILISQKPLNILILGGGDGLALREVLKYPQVKNITLVELDPEMIDLAKTNPHLIRLNKNSLNHPNLTIINPTPLPSVNKKNIMLLNHTSYPISEGEQVKVRVYNFDAVKWVEKINETFDVIILDFPDPHSLELSQLYSLSFYHHLNQLLYPGGILVQQASSPVYVKETFLLIGRTLKQAGFQVLPYQGTVPSFGPWGWWLAGKKEFHDTLANRWNRVIMTKEENWPVSLNYLTPQLMGTGIIFPKNGLKTNKKDYNTILNHLSYRYYLEDNKKFWW